VKSKTIEERLQRIEAIQEITNLMGRYEYMHSSGMHRETVKLFANKTRGVKADIPGFGVFDSGIQGIKRCFAGAHVQSEGDRIGQMHMHTLTTPVIEVAGDGKTARGAWISPGHETAVINGQPQAFWAWCKYGVDFVKEEGKWKIWHLHVYSIFFAPYEKSWVDSTVSPPEGIMDRPADIRPDRLNDDAWTYTPISIYPDDEPAPPEPYATFDDNISY
jgi:hypothetical protein